MGKEISTPQLITVDGDPGLACQTLERDSERVT